ncbi:MAG: TetR/AcrR family transcriptional regulator [Mastigocoleus sp. MO_167.B18]|nr:TetR/AcrR family transcriptional regulator [Mastigocoleus sp. MO_167.B18]
MAHIRVRDVETIGLSNKSVKILQGAMQEFLAHGYTGASMDRIASSAGVSKATVYSHFQGKEGLFKALIKKMTQEKFVSVFGAEPLEGEPKIVLRQLTTKALEEMTSDKKYRDFKRLLIGESGRFPELAKVCVDCMVKPVLETLTKYLASHPELDIPDPEATARIMIGTLVHYVMTQEMMHAKDIIPMEKERIVDALMHLIIK